MKLDATGQHGEIDTLDIFEKLSIIFAGEMPGFVCSSVFVQPPAKTRAMQSSKKTHVMNLCCMVIGAPGLYSC
jgi:hypothetical protein